MPAAAPSIYVVIVLYNQSPASSLAAIAFAGARSAIADVAAEFRVLLYDNSPALQDITQTAYFADAYHHDETNAGLAAAYNYALDQAAAEGCRWLLLLDQDTQVTVEYLQELIALSNQLEDEPRVAAIVPKLESDKGIKSPTLDFLEWLRRQVQFPRKRALFATNDMYGLQDEQFSAFNSAALLRTAALTKIGGFPKEFWLDFLDVAVFNALHADGLRMFVMQATLRHELSMDTKLFYQRQGGVGRHQNLIAAMVRFVRTYGTARDLWLTRIWLLRNALNLFISASNKRFSLASLRQAVVLRGTTPPRTRD